MFDIVFVSIWQGECKSQQRKRRSGTLPLPRFDLKLSRRNVMRHKVFMTLGVVLLVSAAVAAQERGSEISLQGTGFFTKDSTGRGTLQRGTETGGFLVGYRYHFNRWLAAEAVYGYDRNTQQYF
jgi:hypothetical protein